MSHTLAELRRELARSLDSYVLIYASSSTPTTITDTNLLMSGRWKTGHFIGADLYVCEAGGSPPQGENKYVTGFDASTGTLTFLTPFTATVEPGDEVELYQHATVAELNQALMFAVKSWQFTSTDQIQDGVAQYEIVCNGLSLAAQVTGVFVRNSSDEESGYFQISNYRLWEKDGILFMEILNKALLADGNYFRIEYLAQYTSLKDPSGDFLDSAIVGGDLNDHMLLAKRYFYDRRMNVATAIDRDWYAGLLRFTTEEIEKKVEPPRRRSGRARQQRYG